jgi:hypothetical protein
MIIIRLLMSLALPLTLGYCMSAVIFRNKPNLSFLERFSVSWGIGLGLLGLGMFALSLTGFRLNIVTVLLPAIIFIVGLISFHYINKTRVFDPAAFFKFLCALFKTENKNQIWPTIVEKILIILIGLTIIYVFFDALVKPVVLFDAVWRQGCIAKIIFTSGRVLTNQTLELAGPHPYLNPLSQAWIYMGIGTWNDALGKIIFPLCFSALLFIFYSSLRRYTSRIYALLFTYLLTSFPLIIFHTGTAYSDLMQTFYYSAGILYLFQWMESKQRPFLYTSALFLGIGNFVKQSGIPLWGTAAIVLFMYLFLENRDKLRSGLNFLLLSVIVSSPWLFFRDSFLMKNLIKIFSRATPGAVEAPLAQNLTFGLPTLPDIFYHLGKRMFTYADAQILWFMLIMACLLCWKQIWQSPLKYLLLLIVLQIVLVIYAFTDPQTYQYLVDGTLVERAVMYGIPAALFFMAVSFLRQGKPYLG